MPIRDGDLAILATLKGPAGIAMASDYGEAGSKSVTQGIIKLKFFCLRRFTDFKPTLPYFLTTVLKNGTV